MGRVNRVDFQQNSRRADPYFRNRVEEGGL